MKLGISSVLKLPLIFVGLTAVAVGASIVLTDEAPSTLPERAARWFAEPAAQSSNPLTIAPQRPLLDVPVATIEAAGLEVRDEYFVVGVELNGECRAYPLNMLSRPDHHVINDSLGGEPIAVAWCGLCQSPAVYARRASGRTLTLFVSGELYGENMMMKDIETGSDWPQMLGQAVHGPLEGESLAQIPSVWTDWKSWRTEHPETTVLKLHQTVEYYRHDPEPSRSSLEKRYFSNLQWGLVRAGESLSWPLKELVRHPAVNDSLAGLPFVVVFETRTATITAFERRLGDTELTFHLGADGLVDDQTRSVWDPVTGRAIRGVLASRRLTPVAGVVSHLRAWRTLHPDSEVRAANAS